MDFTALRGRLVLLDLLAILFGISSWISINGLWVELPLLVDRLPESWDLPSYLSLIVQIANVGPITYTFLRWMTKGRLPDKPCIYLLLIGGTLSAFLMPLYWKGTAVIVGKEHSVALFALVFCLSLVDCTSSVLFLPFMATFRDIYLNSYLIGEGLSGFVPSVAALVQGVGGNGYCRNASVHNATANETYWEMEKVVPDPRFPIETFFYFLASLMCISLVSFILLNMLPQIKEEYASKHQIVSASETDAPDAMERTPVGEDGRNPTSTSAQDFPPWLSQRQRSMELTEEQRSKAKFEFYALLFVQALACFLSNGAMPSIQTYSCLPYGNLVYHLAVTLSAMTHPLMAFVAFFVPTRSVSRVVVLTGSGLVFVGYILATASYSPSMLAGQQLGAFLTVVSWVIYGGLFSYVKISVAGKCRDTSTSALFWCGAITQVGSAIGALVMFVLLNNVKIFHAYQLTCTR